MSRIQKIQTDPVFKTKGNIFGSLSALQFPAGTVWIFFIFDKLKNHFPCHFANQFATQKMNFGLCVLCTYSFPSFFFRCLFFFGHYPSGKKNNNK